MSSANKPRKIGLFHSIMSVDVSSVGTRHLARAANARSPPGFQVERIAPASTAIRSCKRSSGDDIEHERPAKQLRGDSTIQAQLARLHAAKQAFIKNAGDSKLSDSVTIQAATRRHDEQQIRARKEAELAAARAASEKQLTTPETASTATPYSTYKKATDCGYPPPKSQAFKGKSSEGTQIDVSADSPAPMCGTTAQQESKTTMPTASTDKQLKDVVAKAAHDKMKSNLEVQQLKSESMQKIAELNASLNDKDRTIYDLERNVAAFAKKSKEDKAEAAGSVQKLEASIDSLNREKRTLESQYQACTAAYRRLQKSKEWDEGQLELARKAENILKEDNEKLRKDLETSQKMVSDTQTAAASAVEKHRAAEDKVSALKEICAALMGAITAIPGAKFLRSLNVENLDQDDEGRSKDESDVQWRDYVQLPESMIPDAAATSLVTRQPWTVDFRDYCSASLAPLSTFGKPSVPPSTSTLSFGRPSGVPIATDRQGNIANDAHVDYIALHRELEDFRQEVRKVRDIQDSISENMRNGMLTSSGKVLQMNRDNRDMLEAPGDSNLFTSAYVNFPTIKNFDLDGLPMLEDEATFQKGVNRINSRVIETDSQKKRQQEREECESQEYEARKLARGNTGSSSGDADPAAGTQVGLDVRMGYYEAPDWSKEAKLFTDYGIGQKRKRDDGSDRNSNSNISNLNNSRVDHGGHAEGVGGYRGGRRSDDTEDVVFDAESGYASSPPPKKARFDVEWHGTYDSSTSNMRGVVEDPWKGDLSDAPPVEEDTDMESEVIGGADEENEDFSAALTPRSPPSAGATRAQDRTTESHHPGAGSGNQSIQLTSEQLILDQRKFENALAALAAEFSYDRRKGKENSSRHYPEQTSGPQRRPRRNGNERPTNSAQSGPDAIRNVAGNSQRGGQMMSPNLGSRPAGGQTFNPPRRPRRDISDSPASRPTRNGGTTGDTRRNYMTASSNPGPRQADMERPYQSPNSMATRLQPASRQTQDDPDRYFVPEQRRLSGSTQNRTALQSSSNAIPDGRYRVDGRQIARDAVNRIRDQRTATMTNAPSRDPKSSRGAGQNVRVNGHAAVTGGNARRPCQTTSTMPAPWQDQRTLRRGALTRGGGQNYEADAYADERAAADQRRAQAKAPSRR